MSKKFNTGGIKTLLGNPARMEQAVQENPQEVVRELTSHVALLPIVQIEANAGQPRRNFDQTALQELAESIRVHGLIQPVTVRRLHDKAYQIISGERRYRASQLAGLAEIPAYVRLADDQQMLEMALIENIQREDLNAIEIALTYARLMEEGKLTHEEISDRVGKQRSTITNHLRLLKLPEEIQIALKERSISMGHARSLASINGNLALQNSLLQQIIAEDLSVRTVEEMIAGYQDGKKAKTAKVKPSMPENMRNIQDQFRAFFGGKVDLKRDDKGKGQIIVKFDNDAELNRLIDLVEGSK